MPFDSRIAFLALIGLVACERLVELVLSKRNAARAFARGGVEAESRAFYAGMVLAHAFFFAAAPLEVFLAGRPFRPGLAALMVALAAGAQALRYWAVTTLGDRWNTRVIVVPGEPAVATGPYRYVRHPNYLAVVGFYYFAGAWTTALVASAVNAWILARRIRHEEAALAQASDYTARLGDRRRFLPL